MTATKTAVTADQIIAEVRSLAAERPDFVYRKPPTASYCLYMDAEDEPGCIFGHAFYRLGVDTSDLYGPVRDVLVLHNIGTTAEQRMWMSSVQSSQDNKATWGESVRMADQDYPNV